MDPNEAPMEMNQLIGSLVVHYVLDNDLRALAATNRVMLGLVLGSGNARLHMALDTQDFRARSDAHTHQHRRPERPGGAALAP